jgi:hypothetical protein
MSTLADKLSNSGSVSKITKCTSPVVEKIITLTEKFPLEKITPPLEI